MMKVEKEKKKVIANKKKEENSPTLGSDGDSLSARALFVIHVLPGTSYHSVTVTVKITLTTL